MNTTDVMYKFNLFDNMDGTGVVVQEAINEEEHLVIKLLNSVDEFIKKNPSTKEIKTPVFFIRPGQPDPDGLLSNEIFGLTKDERAGIWGYIDLSDNFIHPLIYKKLIRMDKKFREIIHGTKFYSINDNGELIEDENGKTGIKWLKTNFSKIKIKSTESIARDNSIKFIKLNQDRMWMNKMLVLPAYYRDVNTEGGGKVSVGEINELYASLIIGVRGIKETEDFGISTSDAIRGRVQENILAIYDWYCGNNNDSLDGATGLSKKLGILRRAGQSKTADYGSRLVLSAPDMKVETVDDIRVDITHSAIPLASICANFFPYMLYHVRRFFENEFAPGSMIDVRSKDGTIKQYAVKDPMIEFSDEKIKEELKRFIHGYSNRFIPIEVPVVGLDKKIFYRFKGRYTDMSSVPGESKPGDSTLINRRMTWCDIFYIAAVEATKDKTVLITRFPIDSMYNQFPNKIVVSTTKETEPVYYNNTFYKYYPKITEEDIGTNTSNLFIDTLWMSNLMLKGIGGD